MSDNATTPTEPRLHRVSCLDSRGLHRMAYWEWGNPANPKVLLCIHGLARQGRDFDTLAQAMQDEYRVVCPDVVGRGQSDWLADPMGYQIPAYVADMVTLLARLNADTVHLVGTSMGGLIGLAALPGTPLSRLVINDVGPTIQAEALMRIGAYLGMPVRWNTEAEAVAYLRLISASFGPHTDAQWLSLCRPLLRPDGDGFKLHYDPQIAVPFRAITPELAAMGEAGLWAAWDALTQPTLLLRGAVSDLLSPETAAAMTQRGPKARVVEFAGVGHAPTMVAADQVNVVREFLLS
jgi:pimeloyl-ACP methyl ester carboxylesterase